MNKCIFVIDIWEKHYCEYINNWTTENIKNFNIFLNKCRDLKYTIIFLSTTGKYNYINNEHNYKNKTEIVMNMPCSMVLCACNKNMSCYFEQYDFGKNIALKHKILDMLHHDKNFKKSELKKYISNLLNNNIITRKKNMNEEINKKIIISKTDYIIPDNRDVFLSILKKNNIEEIFYIGQVVNMCISCTRKISINKILNYNFKINIIEDLALFFGYNFFSLEEKKFDENINSESCKLLIKNYLKQFKINFIKSKDI